MDRNDRIYHALDEHIPLEDKKRLEETLASERAEEALQQIERLEKQMAQPVTITYDHPDRGEEERLVTPTHIFLGISPHHSETKHAVWFLQAWCHDRKANRHFPLTRIKSWAEGDARTSPDAEPDAA